MSKYLYFIINIQVNIHMNIYKNIHMNIYLNIHMTSDLSSSCNENMFWRIFPLNDAPYKLFLLVLQEYGMDVDEFLYEATFRITRAMRLA